MTDPPGRMNGPTPPAATSDNPFADLDRLRIPQNFADAIGVKKALLTVPVRKPDKQWFVRVHPDEAYRLPLLLLELKDEAISYLVSPALGGDLLTEVVPKMLFTSINRQGTVFLWPVRLPTEGRLDEWNRSAQEAANVALKRWVRVVSNRSLGAYEVYTAEGTLDDPEWPDIDFKELLSIAFKDRVISTLDHPVLRRLRGEV
jgi:hypothetical protein